MKKILIVDDEAGIVDEVKAYFEEEGFRVEAADSGKEGLRILKRMRPDLLILDIKLPDLNGLELLKAVKESFPQTKVIVITGYVDQNLIDAAERLGRDCFLQKPFDLPRLFQEVSRLLPDLPPAA